MIHRNVVLSGLFAMFCVGVLQAADDASITKTDPTELATKAWVALKAGDHEQVSELTTQCFEEFGDDR